MGPMHKSGALVQAAGLCPPAFAATLTGRAGCPRVGHYPRRCTAEGVRGPDIMLQPNTTTLVKGPPGGQKGTSRALLAP